MRGVLRYLPSPHHDLARRRHHLDCRTFVTQRAWDFLLVYRYCCQGYHSFSIDFHGYHFFYFITFITPLLAEQCEFLIVKFFEILQFVTMKFRSIQQQKFRLFQVEIIFSFKMKSL